MAHSLQPGGASRGQGQSQVRDPLREAWEDKGEPVVWGKPVAAGLCQSVHRAGDHT